MLEYVLRCHTLFLASTTQILHKFKTDHFPFSFMLRCANCWRGMWVGIYKVMDLEELFVTFCATHSRVSTQTALCCLSGEERTMHERKMLFWSAYFHPFPALHIVFFSGIAAIIVKVSSPPLFDFTELIVSEVYVHEGISKYVSVLRNSEGRKNWFKKIHIIQKWNVICHFFYCLCNSSSGSTTGSVLSYSRYKDLNILIADHL